MSKRCNTDGKPRSRNETAKGNSMSVVEELLSRGKVEQGEKSMGKGSMTLVGGQFARRKKVLR